MRVNDTARLNLKVSAKKPGAIIVTKTLAKIIPRMVATKRTTIKREIKWLPISNILSLLSWYSERTGVATESEKPSAKILLNILGKRKIQ